MAALASSSESVDKSKQLFLQERHLLDIINNMSHQMTVNFCKKVCIFANRWQYSIVVMRF